MKRILLAAALAAVAALPTQAATVSINGDAVWHEFTVDNQVGPGFGTAWISFSDGSPLRFTFTVAAGSVGVLDVVDAGFAGDTFSVRNGDALVGHTADVPVAGTDGPIVADFSEAMADASFSHGVFTLGAGSYSIGGSLKQSVLDGGIAMNATNGGLRLTVSPVPEPSTYAIMLGGLIGIGCFVRRRSH